jgi:pimeloyl-ACP methyl ester carboxylesterase
MNDNSTNVRMFTPRSGTTLRVLRTVLGVTSSVAPALASQLALQLFLTPRRHRRPRRESNLLWLGDRRDLPTRSLPAGSSNYAPLPTWSWGSGPTVILVHGWEGRGAQLGALVPPLVEAGFRVITFDAPGHGSSAGRQSSLPAFADAIETVAAAYGPIHAIVAHSMGAGATMLAEHRRRAQGLELATRNVYLAPPGSVDTFTRMFAETLNLSPAVRAGMLQEIERKFNIQFADLSPTDLVAGSNVEHFVVHDKNDAWVPHAEGQALAAAAKHGEVLCTENLGHHRLLRDPTVVAAVTAFVQRDVPGLKGTPFAQCLDRELYDRESRFRAA